ncbi:hypothetical protein JD844_027931 [Phrynosoma platyrhinos]|uniref:TBC1 domain family member 30 n=1 Tax=Phrynosoma platyrhinos TaxID=52577 RepID=A0ABQ7SHE0_PHRPL|nr:hypothetical protein JD844_027931 [Phrynosoma platyrhinos]
MELAEVSLAEEAPRGPGGSSAEVSLAEEEEEEEEEEGEFEEVRRRKRRRASSASSLVSGLLTELYSAGRTRHRDSVDSSTEASAGSDAFPGGRGTGPESRVLQELQRRPGQRHQRHYLAQKDTSELTTIIRELNYRICVQSAKLLRLLKQKDRLLHKVQKNCDIVTACLQAVSQKRRKYHLSLLIQECWKCIPKCTFALVVFSKCLLVQEKIYFTLVKETGKGHSELRFSAIFKVGIINTSPFVRSVAC